PVEVFAVNIPVTGVLLNKTTATLALGNSETLVPTIAPATATNRAVTWTTSDATKVMVNSAGKITALGEYGLMAGKKLNLKALASAPMAGFRTKTVTVEEWEGATVVLREPSGAAWVEWRQIITPQEAATYNAQGGKVDLADALIKWGGQPEEESEWDEMEARFKQLAQ
uniref:BIG2 domain-containing protein n=1 Tax=Anopheles maculatus TaxID=74869 RepID=A0A182SM09_9DIPT